MRRCSSTRSWSRSATARSATGPIYAAIGVDLDGHKDILGHVGRRRRRGVGEVLAGGAHRAAQPRRAGRVLRGLRRAEGPARQRERGVPAGHRADLHHPLDPQHVPLRLPQVLGPICHGPASRSTRPTPPTPPQRRWTSSTSKWGRAVPGDRSGCGATPGSEFIPFLDYDVEIRKVHLLAPTRSSRLNARYRRAVRARGHFPNEQAAMKMPVPGHPVPGPQGHRSDTMGDAVEASPQRLRHHLRRPHAGRREPLNMKPPLTPFVGQSHIRSGNRPRTGRTQYEDVDRSHGRQSAVFMATGFRDDRHLSPTPTDPACIPSVGRRLCIAGGVRGTFNGRP